MEKVLNMFKKKIKHTKIVKPFDLTFGMVLITKGKKVYKIAISGKIDSSAGFYYKVFSNKSHKLQTIMIFKDNIDWNMTAKCNRI